MPNDLFKYIYLKDAEKRLSWISWLGPDIITKHYYKT